MLKANSDRLDYSEMLIPPVGYKTAFAIGTTYSLDLEALIGVSISLGLNEDIDSKLSDSPIYLLEALRKVTDKMLIFCEAGQIKAPATQNKLFPFLENSVVMVNAKNDKSFHPKVWLVKYENDSAEVVYRILVLSRNLTFDRSWDVAVCVEGKPSSKIISRNKSLVDFMTYLHERMESRYEKMAAKKRSLKKFLDELMQVEFQLNDKHFDNFDFIPLGIYEGYNKDYTELFNTYHELFIISPFLSKTIMDEFKGLQLTNADKTLVTRKSELHKLSKDFLQNFNTYTLKDDVIDGEDRLAAEGEIKKQDIHAKLYLRTKYSESELFLGSANASENAFNGNIEFMLNLYSKRRWLNVDNLKNDLFGNDEKLNPFEKVKATEYEVNDTDDIKDNLQKAIKEFCKVKSVATVSEGYTVTITIGRLKTDIELFIAPLLIAKREQVRDSVVFNGLELSQLSEFYVVTAQTGKEALSRVVKIKTEGIPEERDSSIFNSIIGNKEGFIQYISFLLGDDYLLTFIEDGMKKGVEYKFLTASCLDTPVLYEKMLKAAARSPEKLKEIKQVMAMITDENIIPEHFYTLYNTFEKAVLK